jgi:hypothetical protein
MALSDEFGKLELRLPLVTSPRVRVANALREDWAGFCPPGPDVYCVGNPPFIGAKYMAEPQRRDVKHVFGAAKNAGLLDYVACWYLKAADWMARDERAEACFVSTNSITQGEQPAVLWAELWRRGVVVNFAHRTFAWTSEAREKAAVHCVIIGFALRHRAQKRLWEYEQGRGAAREVPGVKGVNPYLVDGPMVALPRRSKPLSTSPKFGIGNKPIDGGWLVFTDEERASFLADEPDAARLFRRYIGSDEFIDGSTRWFLWLADEPPQTIRTLPAVRARLERVAAFRRGEEEGRNGRRAKDALTKKLAETPTRLHVRNTPTTS